MNDLQIFNTEVIPVYTTDEGSKVVIARELHEKLDIKTQYSKWFARMVDYGFVEGSDYFTVVKNVYREDDRTMPQVQTDHIMTLDMAKHIAMIQRTPQGMAIRQKLIDLEKEIGGYMMPKLSKEMQALFLLDDRTQKQEQRITALENTMVVDYNQQRVLRKSISRAVVSALGGEDAPAYIDPHVRGKVYSECNRDVQDWFRVNSVGNIPRKDFDKAVEYIQRWKPSTNTVMLIQQTNDQTSMFAQRNTVTSGRLMGAEVSARG